MGEDQYPHMVGTKQLAVAVRLTSHFMEKKEARTGIIRITCTAESSSQEPAGDRRLIVNIQIGTVDAAGVSVDSAAVFLVQVVMKGRKRKLEIAIHIHQDKASVSEALTLPVVHQVVEAVGTAVVHLAKEVMALVGQEVQVMYTIHRLPLTIRVAVN